MMTLIRAERPDTADARALIGELEAHLEPYYPKTSRHGYSVEKLLQQGVAFFVARYDGIPAGCGGVQFYGRAYGEIKRLFVREQFRGLGLAQLMLKHLEEYALEQGIRVLRLETGIHQKDAIRLYEKWGFQNIPPFGEYVEDPLSRFFEKRI
jgi:putative acetyltransferase